MLYIDEGNVLTSAGTAAAIDLCLYMVRQDHGAEVANVFARRMIVPPHREGGQAQFVEAPVPGRVTATTSRRHSIGRCTISIRKLTVEAQLAERARMSPRTFARRFYAATGTTPLQWLLQQRRLRGAPHARGHRPTPSITSPVDVGFGAASTLRMHFRRVTGTTPQAYRASFRAA